MERTRQSKGEIAASILVWSSPCRPPCADAQRCSMHSLLLIIKCLFAGWDSFPMPFRGRWWRPTFSTVSPTEVSRLRHKVGRCNAYAAASRRLWLLWTLNLLTLIPVSFPRVTPAHPRSPGLCVRCQHSTSRPFGGSAETKRSYSRLFPVPLSWAIIFILFTLDGSFAVVMYLQQKEVRVYCIIKEHSARLHCNSSFCARHNPDICPRPSWN